MFETPNTVCIVGMIGVTREAAATAGATLSVFGGGINPGAEVPAGVDGDYILEFARVHEESGFDMVLTGYSSSTPDGFEVAGYARFIQPGWVTLSPTGPASSPQLWRRARRLPWTTYRRTYCAAPYFRGQRR